MKKRKPIAGVAVLLLLSGISIPFLRANGWPAKHWHGSSPPGPAVAPEPATACEEVHIGANYDFDDESFLFRYNRVDGLFFGARKPYETYRRHGTLQLFGMAGVGLKSKRFQYRIALERSFFPIDFRFAIGIEFYDFTFSEDNWIIPPTENSLAAFLIHEDFQDFYRRTGYGAYVFQNFSRFLQVRAGYYEESHESLPNKTDWALFGGKKHFRPNPPVDPVSLKGIYGRVYFDTRNRRRSPRRGWLVQGIAEYFPADLDNAVSFERYIVDLRRYQPISRGENINLRIRVGETAGRVPVQKYFDLGGISTLRAYRFKEFTGTRMVLGNLEYVINWDKLDWYPDIPFFDLFDFANLVLFVDSGLAWERGRLDFQKLRPEQLYTDVGIALTNDDQTWRLNIAKRTDRSEDAVRVTFRISRPF